MKTSGFIYISVLVVAGASLLFLFGRVAVLERENAELRERLEVEARDFGPAGDSSEGEEARIQADRLELARLRNEVQRLRAEAKPLAADGVQRQQPASSEVMQGALRGEPGALGLLAAMVEEARVAQKRSEDPNAYFFGEVREVFTQLGRAAGNNDPNAEALLFRAVFHPDLKGFAAFGLGEAASLGHESALNMLLNPGQFGLLESTVVSALRPAAAAGNERAIEYLASFADKPRSSGLWYLVAQGLAEPAAADHDGAIEALMQIIRQDIPNASREARRALEQAAFLDDSQPKARAALATLAEEQQTFLE